MRNDIATSLVAIVCATIGDRYWSYADPVGAILVCGLIATSWFHHAIQQVPILVGVRAERDQLSRILKIVIEHDDRIRQIHHIMVYHTGLQATVELHIVMDENLPLKVCTAAVHFHEVVKISRDSRRRGVFGVLIEDMRSALHTEAFL
ncbi:hypothetical protein Y032_0155g3043 [Ancylostoma ceylanicum]|uniref:Cation efflux protein cytoplasmic domain-containing protein n=1 Tax=Ancylostoma ceylanicum TaxID=53326 RepID=A0A016SZF7_9BILA|nr:hypothetical protein Y032_0155g3043 [Ancylostoma ceylanicum]